MADKPKAKEVPAAATPADVIAIAAAPNTNADKATACATPRVASACTRKYAPDTPTEGQRLIGKQLAEADREETGEPHACAKALQRKPPEQRQRQKSENLRADRSGYP